jgi:leader peptidase (prepilin peptidase)/N-methyltransferase
VTPVWVVVVAALVMGVVGHLTGRELATGGYRIDEDEADHSPGRNWWPGVATAALAGLAAWSIGDLGGWAALPAYLLFAWLTAGLIWIDLDVHRLPVGLVVPTGWWLVALLAVASLATGDRRWLGALIGAGVMGAVYLLLAVLPGGGVGGGDVRLAPVIGGLLGWLGSGALLVGLLAGFLVGGLAAVTLLALRRAGLRSTIAYGPAMCLGAWVGIAFTSRILTWLMAG